MTMSRFKLVLLSIGLLIAFGIVEAKAACLALSQSDNALVAQDLDMAALAVEDARNDQNCSESDLQKALRIGALIEFNSIVSEVNQGQSLDGFFDQLTGINTRVGGPWQVLDALAEISKSRGERGRAANFYTLALEDASNLALTPDWMAPDETYLRYMINISTEMQLAATQVPLNSLRSGCRLNYRGITVQRKTTPVRFEFNKVEMTMDGEAAARELSACLNSLAPAEITLIGHTDPSGTAQYNLKLSVGRAEALSEYLIAHGFNGSIGVVGRGEEEPFKVDDPTAYDQATLFQIHRRVDVDILSN